jgi:pilus assembly protein TadC
LEPAATGHFRGKVAAVVVGHFFLFWWKFISLFWLLKISYPIWVFVLESFDQEYVVCFLFLVVVVGFFVPKLLPSLCLQKKERKKERQWVFVFGGFYVILFGNKE